MKDKFDRFYSDEDKEIWEDVFREFKSQQKWKDMTPKDGWTDKSIGLPVAKWDDVLKEFRIPKDITMNGPKDKEPGASAQHLTPKMTNIHYQIIIAGRIANCKNSKKKALANQSFDLLKAINTYRTYRTVGNTLESLPELRPQEEHITILYDHFDKMDDMGLADLYIDMIREIEVYLDY